MADPASLPEPDRIDGAPHPRETRSLFGHAEAQAGFLDAFRSGRLHHGWLIAGPKGIGKATLAWHLARFLLATPEDDGGMFAAPPPETLDIPDEHPVARRMRALAEPRLFLLRRGPNDRGTALSLAMRGQRADLVRGEVPNPITPPPGCSFHPRCPLANERCRREAPLLRDLGGAHQVACHAVEEERDHE